MRFYNSGKYKHVWRDSHTAETKEELRDLKPSGHPVGTAIVNIPGMQRKAVAAGEWVDIPESLFGHFEHPADQAKADLANERCIAAVQSACPSLLTEQEAAPIVVAAAPPSAKSKGKE